MTTTYKIPAKNLPFLKDQIEKLNKRVAKLAKKGYDAKPIEMIVGQAIIERNEAAKLEYIFFPVEFKGNTKVVVAGWEFIATLQHEEGGVILRAVPGAVAEGELTPFRDAKPVCNHCGWERRRNDTFILRNEAKEYKQVGRNCLADFFGMDAKGAAMAAEIYAAAAFAGGAMEDDEFGVGDRLPSWVTISNYLPYVAKVMRVQGWLSKGKAYERDGHTHNATATIAWDHMNEHAAHERVGDHNKAEAMGLIPTEADEKAAREAIEFCAVHFEAVEENMSDYEHNLRVAMIGGVVDARLSGIVGSAFVFVANQKRKLEAAKNAPDFSKSQHVGILGQRQVFNLKCVYTPFGNRPAVFVDEAGNKVTCYPKFDVVQGQTYAIAGTPTKQDEYKGVKSTYINRVTIHVPKAKGARKAKKVATPVVEKPVADVNQGNLF